MTDDGPNLVHIHAHPADHSRLREELETARKRGLFEGYEFIVTGPDVGVVDVDAIADAVAERLEVDG